MRVWVTGAAGSVGRALMERFDYAIGTDLDLDVTDAARVKQFAAHAAPDVVFHCAAAKHAPEGETDPWHTLEVNAAGTRNILEACPDARVVLASTCKAADPETAYGASKLLAERMVLNAGGTVARFFNVRETQGNVFTIWADTPEDAPIRTMPCWRYFITLEQAVELMEACVGLPSGRYMVDPGEAVFIPHLAAALYPNRERVEVAPRRGDRLREPLIARSESLSIVDGWIKVESPHDPSE